MSNCSKCGAVLPAGAQTCATCGSPVEVAPVQPAAMPEQQGMQQESPKKKKGKIVAIVIAVLVVLFAISCCGGGEPAKSPSEVKADWNASIAAEVLPYPEAGKVDIYINDEDSLSAHAEEFTKQEYEAYVESCKEKGFTVEVDDSTGYEAFNAEGYGLRLAYFDGLEQMQIHLDAPEKFGSIKWPTSEVASLLPVPKSTTGKIEWDKSNGLCVYVAETPYEDYSAYVEECAAKGFAVDYDKGEKFYSANNEAGYRLRLEYQGFNVMLVKLEAPSEEPAPVVEEPEVASDAESTATPTAEPAAAGLDPAFKESMDAYEEFMDGYIEFMTTYNSSDDILGMAADYAKWMADYAEAMSKLDAIDENSLGAEELAYYTEVTTRVNDKLIAAAV